ncbi:hypothetical protein PI124_g21667 [Phytophthora idaei]|nr:hypothetical protein PI125_g8192 [Phytophthora idaei]KAG3146186.1 hypothetical protein PI126_g13429 [Phytophthora idaei]KAG3233255.1 hypothetical protein PI124_g21667 [Phytophthora idaei]
MARRLSMFSEYNVVVHYKPGKTNILADVLSGRPDYDPRMTSGRHAVGDEEDDEECAVCDSRRVRARCGMLRDDKYLKAPTDSARRRLSSRSRSCVDRYAMDGDLLTFQVDRVDPPRVVVPLDDDLRARLMHEFHDTPSAGHLGRTKTFAAISRDYYWPHMYRWVRKWVRSCEAC